MKRKHRRHSEEFKREVIEYSLSTNKSIKQICRDFEIAPNLFYTWRKQLLGDAESERAVGERGNEISQTAATPMEMADEIRRLRKELAKSQRREEILKKAALILGNDPHNNMS